MDPPYSSKKTRTRRNSCKQAIISSNTALLLCGNALWRNKEELWGIVENYSSNCATNQYSYRMSNSDSHERDTVFISKATPGDDAFVLWLAPKLEAAGYKVFADIISLDTGDEWRSVITATLHNNAIKMLLCCSNATLSRRGVKEEIGIAEDLVKKLGDPNFILPLRLEPYDKLFGIGELQYQDFTASWADGLSKLLKSLEKQNVPRASGGAISPNWAIDRRRFGVELVEEPEVLTSNWLRLLQVPDELVYIRPKNPCDPDVVRKLGQSFRLPLADFERGFVTFASPMELDEHFIAVGPFEATHVMTFTGFVDQGDEELGIEPREAKSMILNLLRQAWEKYCRAQGLLEHEYANGVGFHVGDDKADIGGRIGWGRQGQRRHSMLRNKSKKKQKVWEYGVSAIPSLFPFPHLKLKGRVLFSELEKDKKGQVISDHRVQHRLRRSMCSGWRNKAWHGRVMAFMELMAGDSPYVDLPVGAGGSITFDAMPVQVTSPVTARQTNLLGEDGQETDPTTLGGHFDEDDA